MSPHAPKEPRPSGSGPLPRRTSRCRKIAYTLGIFWPSLWKTRRGARLALLLPLMLLCSCMGNPANPATTRPATAVDPKSADPAYWYAQPGVADVESPDFTALWKSCKLAARDDGFDIDRPGYRDGLMTTPPLVSKQIFQPWRSDVVNDQDLMQSTLGTVRRTIHFEIARTGSAPDAAWECIPKVVVERFSIVEHRITNASEYRDIFTLTRSELTMEQENERDPTNKVPPLYWYAIGRDHGLERQLADQIRQHLAHPQDLQGIVPVG